MSAEVQHKKKGIQFVHHQLNQKIPHGVDPNTANELASLPFEQTQSTYDKNTSEIYGFGGTAFDLLQLEFSNLITLRYHTSRVGGNLNRGTNSEFRRESGSDFRTIF